ncbi:GNAT family N-acetyltransferase, partial [Mesorhizobium sp. M2D.F.Ca.ET.140.01.1.1]
MANITLNNIFQPGNIYAEDEDKVIYLTPQIP